MTAVDELTRAAEERWLSAWAAGPTEAEGCGLIIGAPAPDLDLVDDTGARRALSEFWNGQPALVMFWRHFGCGCGAARATRLTTEWSQYAAAGLNPVIVAPGEPARAAAYRAEHEIACPVLCDPGYAAYRAYGLGHWPVERILFDAPAEYWSHPRDLGVSLQDSRRKEGRPLVDDPWRAVAEFVIGKTGRVRLPYVYQSCEDFPDARLLATASRLC